MKPTKPDSVRNKRRAAAEIHPWADWIEAVGTSHFEIERIGAEK